MDGYARLLAKAALKLGSGSTQGIEEIKAVIPQDASESNQLTTTNYVDSRQVYLTQEEYDSLTEIDPTVQYCIWE